MPSRSACFLLMSFAISLGSPSSSPAGAAEAKKESANARLGMNLAGPADWNTELPFVDVFRLSRRWISQRKGLSWGRGPAVSLDEYGWVTKLEPDCWVETPVCTIDGGHYPAGKYTVLYDGEGKLEFWNAATVVSESPGRATIEVTPLKGAFHIKIMATNPENYIRNIRTIMPDFQDSYRENPWHPLFLKRWQGVSCLRFMDWMLTNGSKVSRWSERPRPEDATFAAKGLPLEWMIDLSNRLGADPWFCIPHRADDDYVRRFAMMVKERLDPKRKVYVEYSNELWNGMFAQSRYAGEEGQKLRFAEKPWEAGWRYTAYRSVQIFRIWEDVFGEKERLVRVLSSQAANAYVSERIVEFQDAYKHADALAIAPYISLNVHTTAKPNTEEVARWTVDQVLDHVESKSLPESIQWMRSSKEVADKYGLKLVAYEGGQHLVGVGGSENNTTLTALLQAANAHPRMGGIYEKYLDAWVREGGDLFCSFSSVSRWSKWGSWGLMQYYDDDPAKSPKFAATMRWARKLGQPVNAPE
jgi:hypothetical protein